MDLNDLLVKHAFLSIKKVDIHYRDEMKVVKRILNYYGMSYIKQGSALVRMHGREYVTKPGVVTIFPPGIPHDHIIISEEPAIFMWWYFEFKIANAIDALSIFQLPVMFEITNTIRFENAFKQYVELIKRPLDLPNIIFSQAKSLEVLAFLFEAAFKNMTNNFNPEVPECFLRILNDIVEAPEHGCKLYDLSAKYNLNSTYITNRFKKFFGMTPIQLQHKLIIDKAKTFLKNSSMPISELADILGFKDFPTFTRLFTLSEGISPLAYKQKKS